MLLSPLELRSFLKLHRTLMFFVNQRLEVLPDQPAMVEDFAKLAPKPLSKVEPDAALNVILGLMDRFCNEHLTDEYATVCRKMAEKLARKRP